MSEISELGNKMKDGRRGGEVNDVSRMAGKLETRKRKEKHIFPSRLRTHCRKERTATS